MRVFFLIVMVIINFILQTTLFRHFAIQGIFPNTALIIVVSHALLRGKNEGILIGFFTGLLFDTFFGLSFLFYTIPYVLIGYITGKGQKDFYRENYLLPILFCMFALTIYESYFFLIEFLMRGKMDILFYTTKVLMPMLVYSTILTLPIYRLLFSVNEYFESKQRYQYRLF